MWPCTCLDINPGCTCSAECSNIQQLPLALNGTVRQGDSVLQAISSILQDIKSAVLLLLPDSAIEGKRQLLNVRALRTALAARIDIGASARPNFSLSG